jgi:hypothetical protein
MAIEIEYIDPADLSNQDYSSKDLNLINQNNISTAFNPSLNYIEYTIYNNGIPLTFYNYNGYSIVNSGLQENGDIYSVDIDIEKDLLSRGYKQGSYNVLYNFLNNELGSSSGGPFFYVKSISFDRTEIIIASSTIPNADLEILYNDFRSKLDSTDYFQDFYLNFGSNRLIIANNIALNNETNQYELAINLYEPLPSDILLLDTFWVVTQVANPIAASTSFPPSPVVIRDNINILRGPNVNLPIKDQVNNTTEFATYEDLILTSSITTQYSQFKNILDQKSININIDYTDFSNFIHFSSAASRINNFYYKVTLIENASSSLSIINNLNNTNDFSISGSKTYYTNLINNTISNFDGYEYFLYYGSGSWSWPKVSTATKPYVLRSTGSIQVTNWLNSVLASASYYDENNQDYVYYSIPEYLQNDDRNNQYFLFLDLIGQYYDNIWIYYKDVTNRYNADNRLDYGISKDLIAEALKSFGIKLYQNNFSTDDLYSAFLGYTSSLATTSNTLPISANSGLEYINNLVSASYDAKITPLDDLNKETYKRLYHNLPYLFKTKGTIPGLRALINCFGIPDTILRISEFGGRDKDTSTYDYFDNKFNYAAYMDGLRAVMTSSFLLNSNFSNFGLGVPQAVQFRFKPYLGESFNFAASQSLLFLSNPSSPSISSSAIVLRYEETRLNSGSYSGSIVSPTYQNGKLYFYPDTNDLDSYKILVEFPFFNEDWWSVMITSDSDNTDYTYTIYVGSKGYYDGYDGNQIPYYRSSSLSFPDTNGWKSLTKAEVGKGFTDDGVTFNDYVGYIQELRYWSKPPGEEAFKDFVMNPSSIDYDGGENNYADYLAFRAPLGNELYIDTKSVHPKITGSWAITQSFSSNTSDLYTENVEFNYRNRESFFYDQPIVGIKNRVTDKIQIVSSSYPTGSVLSQYRSLEQTYPTLGSETPDINLLEVAFSPQNEINNDIISSLGYFNIGEYIGDPRQATSSNYPDLNRLSNDFFQKYFDTYNLFDYIRLIKYFDNSLFKMIQDFVPARTSLASGIVVKQHLLERSKYPEPQVSWEELDYSGSVYSQQIWDDNISGSYIETSTIGNTFGKTGGTFDSYNFTGSTLPPTFINNTQSWLEPVKTPYGLTYISQSSQQEFYNGELPGTEFVAEDGELNPGNLYKYPSRIDTILDWGLTETANASYTSLNTAPYQPSFLANISNVNPDDPTTYTYTSATLKVNTPPVTPLQITASVTIVWNTGSGTTSATSPTIDLSAYFYFTRQSTAQQALNDTTPGKKLQIFVQSPNSYTAYGTRTATVVASGTWLPSTNETYNIIFQRSTPGQISGNSTRWILTASANITINQTLPPGTSPVSSSQIANYTIFEYGNYNAIINNAEDIETSQYFLDVDYSQNPVTPVNQNALVDNSALHAPVQDSNYDSYAWSNIRYNGVRYNSIKINQ